jgi:hypothetical protein
MIERLLGLSKRAAVPLVGVLLFASIGLNVPPTAEAQQDPQRSPRTFRIFRVGSSSFGPALIENTKRIVNATGRFVLDWEPKRDSAGYTRLDQFISQPGLCDEWCKK